MKNQSKGSGDAQKRQSDLKPMGWFTLVLGGFTVVLCALLVIGAFLPNIPYLGVAGSLALPLIPLWVIVLSFIGGGLTLTAWLLGSHRIGKIFTLLAILTVIGASIITAQLVHTAQSHGAHINLWRTLHPGFRQIYGKPDETLTYLTDMDHELKMDIYLSSQQGDDPAPIILYIHGGAWILNDRTYQTANMRWYPQQGWLVASIDYTLATEERQTWDIVDSQVACALPVLVSHADRLSADVTRIALLGDSAGGNLAINTAYAANAGRATSACGGTVPSISAVAVVYPAVDPTGIWRNTDPVFGNFARSFLRQYIGGPPEAFPERFAHTRSINTIHPNAPPTLILMGDNDHLLPIDGTLTFVQAAQSAGLEIELIRFPFSDHGFDLTYYGIGNQASQQIVKQFLESQP